MPVISRLTLAVVREPLIAGTTRLPLEAVSSSSTVDVEETPTASIARRNARDSAPPVEEASPDPKVCACVLHVKITPS